MWLDNEPEYGLDHPELIAQWQTDWRNENFNPETAVEALGFWLVSTAYEIALRVWWNSDLESQTISLMEVLELWLYRGDGLAHCPTHESFLVAVIEIIDNWRRNDYKSIDDSRLWWHEDNGEALPIPLFPEDHATKHGRGLLDRNVFIHLKERRQAKDQEILAAKIDQILATLKGDTPD